MGVCLYCVIYDRLRACLKDCFYSTIFIALVIALYSSMLNLLIQLPLLFYFVLYPVWITYPPQDPIIRSSAAQRAEGRFVPVLGSTPSVATLLGSYPRAKWMYRSCWLDVPAVQKEEETHSQKRESLVCLIIGDKYILYL